MALILIALFSLVVLSCVIEQVKGNELARTADQRAQPLCLQTADPRVSYHADCCAHLHYHPVGAFLCGRAHDRNRPISEIKVSALDHYTGRDLKGREEAELNKFLSDFQPASCGFCGGDSTIVIYNYDYWTDVITYSDERECMQCGARKYHDGWIDYERNVWTSGQPSIAHPLEQQTGNHDDRARARLESNLMWAGQIAFMRGALFVDNPHRLGTLEFDKWEEGWAAEWTLAFRRCKSSGVCCTRCRSELKTFTHECLLVYLSCPRVACANRNNKPCPYCKKPLVPKKTR